MPQVIPAVVAGLAAGSWVAGGSLILGFSTTAFVGSLVLSGVGALLAPKPPKSSGFQGQKGGGITRQIRQPLTPRRMVFGEVRTSGPYAFIGSSDDNEFLHMIIVTSSHEVEEVGEVWINEDSITDDMLDANGDVTTGKYYVGSTAYIRIKKMTGATDQAALQNMIDAFPDDWTTSHRLRGCSYLYVRLKYNTDVFPGGIPVISSWLKGYKTYDSRTDTSYWHHNPMMILRSYLRDTDLGISISDTKFNDDATDSGANTCEEFVATTEIAETVSAVDASTDIISLDNTILQFQTGDRVQVSSDTSGGIPAGISAATNYYVIVYQRKDTARIKLASSYANAIAGTAVNITDEGSGTITITKNAEPRYNGGGIIDSDIEPQEAITGILSAMAGKALYTGGKWTLTAGAYQTPTLSYDESDLVSGYVVNTKISRRDRFNRVIGTYTSQLNNGQPADYPPVTNSTYQTEDGEQIDRNYDLPFTQRPHMAQRLAKIALEQARQEITFSAKFKLTAFKFQIGDNILLSITRMGWTNKAFEVVDWSYNEEIKDGAVTPYIEVKLKETASTVYDWNNGEETAVDPAPNTSFPDVLNVGEPGAPVIVESLYSSRNGGGVKALATVTCTASTDAFVERYQFRYKLNTDTEYITLAETTVPKQEIFDIPPGVYEFGVRAINALGVKSDWVTTSPQEIYVLSAAPEDIAGLNIQAISSLALLRWNLHPDLDVKEGGLIKFRHSPALSGATWATSVSIGESVAGNVTETLLPLKEGTYLARAFDSTGNLSENSVKVTTKAATIASFSNVETITENPDFSGSKSGCTIETSTSPDVLKIDGVGLFDDIADFDSVSDLDAYGGISSSGTYDFASGTDLGSVQTVRLESHIKATVVNVLYEIDDRTEDIDDWESFDGQVTGESDCQIWVRETDDDPAASPTWGEWQRLDVGEYTARAFQYQARLSSSDPAYNIYVEELKMYVDQ